MNELMTRTDLREIVMDEVLPYPVDAVWRVLTTGELMGRWMMKPTGFAPEVGNRFTFQTTPAGAWDGTIHCEVLEVVSRERFSFAWRGGDAGNIGYGSKLDTIVSWTLSESAGATRLVLRHSGFELPRNETAYTNMGKGWKVCLERVSGIVEAEDGTGTVAGA